MHPEFQKKIEKIMQQAKMPTMDNENTQTGGGNGSGGDGIGERVARMESDIEYIKRDITEIKSDIKHLESSIKSDFKHQDSRFWTILAVLVAIMLGGFTIMMTYLMEVLKIVSQLPTT